jgi:SWI/SNF-related matrix-associated actin-dependent regulator 1 of chromatin subfamily A
LISNTSNPIEIKALDILDNYSGTNNYIQKLKYLKETNKKFYPTRSQAEYIINYHNVEPKIAKKWVNIEPYFAKKIADEKNMLSIPTDVWVEKLLVDKDKSYHIWGKFNTGDTITDMWLPKAALLKTHNTTEVKIDYSKYVHRPPLEHQKIAIEKLVGSKRFILADDMGLGKTTSAIIAALETNEKKILIVCPASLKLNWEREIRNYTDRSVFVAEGKNFSNNHDFVIVNYDILKNFHDTKNHNESKILNQFDVILADECFTYDTLVKTDKGDLKIGEIVENNLDVKVLTYNHTHKITEYKKILRRLIKNTDTIYEIKLQNGVFIECTKNHKFFVKNKGYVRADKLSTNDSLFELSKNFIQETNLEKNKNLFTKLRYKLSLQSDPPKEKRKRNKIYKKLFKLWQKYELLYHKSNEKTELLFSGLCIKTKMGKREYERKIHRINEKTQSVTNYERHTQKKSKSFQNVFTTYEGEQPNEKYRICRKNEKKVSWSNISFKRWERKIDTTTDIITSNVRRRMDYGITYTYKGIQRNRKKFTFLLQSRHCTPKTKSYYRNRWEISQDRKMEIFGQTEDKYINIVGVESIKILERGNYGNPSNLFTKNTRVYDLETEDNHNYFVNGILVSNCHYVNNPQSQRTKLFNDFVKKSKYLWLLTGTPMTSRPINYYNLLNLIESPVAQNWMAYVIRYCQGYQFKAGNRKVWNVNGASNLEELRDRTSRQVLRRLKTDVLDLPEKIITPIYLRLKSKKYEELMGEYYEWFNKHPNESKSLTVQFNKLMKVRQVIAEEKIDNTIEVVENILELGKKVIIFTNFTDTLHKIHSHFGKKSVYLDGTCSKVHRQHAVDQFQENDKIKVFVGNLQAAGVGITLTAGEAVVFNDLSFVPAHHQQAEDRAYRYGQKNCVSVYYPLFENTIEGVIYDMLINKKNIIDTVMGDNLDKAEFIEQIMNRINNV